MPLGVINIAIVDAAVAGRGSPAGRRAAIGIGIGGALADTIHAALAFVGVGQLLVARPDVVRALAFAAAALIVAYAIVGWRAAKREPRQLTRPASILTGFLLTLPNPGALSAWVAVAALWPVATTAEAITLAIFVGIGSALWFTFLAHLVGKLPRDHRALRVIPKLAIGALLALAVVGIVRVL
ncbi:MAG TPA: LysE family transporter [Xanthomonadales bacterium]|nr:LysE family transporter [Xanthomonadales bacterium]